MFFQIDITPKSKKREVSNETKNAELRFSLALEPFQPQTKIELETTINTSVQCYLDIKNTSNKSIHISVTKAPAKEWGIQLNFHEVTIKSKNSATMCIKWHPKEVGYRREILQFMDNRHIKYDVAIITTAKVCSKDCSKENENKRLLPISSSQVMDVNKMLCKDRQIEKDNVQKPSSITLKTKYPMKGKLNLSIKNKENINISENYNPTTDSLIKRDISTYKSGDHNDFLQSIDLNSLSYMTLNKNDNLTDEGTGICSNIGVIPQQLSIISEETEIRRTTYVKDSTYLRNITTDINEKEISLFHNQHELHSEFSMLLNDLVLEPDDIIMSLPQECASSTKNNPTDSNYDNTSKELLLEHAAGDGTYIVPAAFNVPTDKTNQLSQSFFNLSPINPMKKDILDTCSTKDIPSSSPIQDKSSFMMVQDLPKTHFTHFPKLSVGLSVKDVLEADLWAKSDDCSTTHKLNEDIKANPIIRDCLVSLNETSNLLNKTQILDMEKLKNICIEISPPKRQPDTEALFIREISPVKYVKVANEQCLRDNSFLKRVLYTNVPNASIRSKGNATSSLNKMKNINTQNKIKRFEKGGMKIHKSDDFTKCCDINSFKFSITENPFFNNNFYCCDKFIHIHANIFQNWLNALISLPENLNADVETTTVDIGKVWQLCKMKEDSILAETKETICAKYTDAHLYTLRKAASAMFAKEEVQQVLLRTVTSIEKGILSIRLDRDLRKDIGLQKEMLELFFSYNPLWLRIGLETIYSETVPLQSNNDLIGLTKFIFKRFFFDPSLKRTYANAYYRRQQNLTFITQMNKFILKKFLSLIYFLDYAKVHKLIRQDPCLFHKKAKIKDSRSILLAFSREVLSGIGDVTKVLRSFDYSVSHKQTYLDEFNYAVANVMDDLRDGVRICRLVELISGLRNLTQLCRVPAISRLQKIHNVDVALKALSQCGFTFDNDIDARAIVDGNLQKIFSFLWQIIFKYEAPRFRKAAICIQKWWRAMLWYVRIKNYLRKRRNNAAYIIQSAWRCKKARIILNFLKEMRMLSLKKREEAALCIQHYWKRKKHSVHDRNQFLRIKCSAIKLQRWWRRIRSCISYIKILKEKRNALVIIQRHWRSILQMRVQRVAYVTIKNAVIQIQIYWRKYIAMRLARIEYLKLREATVRIQLKWRSLRTARLERKHYRVQLECIYKIQIWWRSILSMRRDRNNFLIVRSSVEKIKRWWMAIIQRKQFLSIRIAIVTIQRNWRKCLEIKRTMRQLQMRKRACIIIQSWWRMIQVRQQYESLLRTRHEAALILQRRWRSALLTKRQQYAYNQLKCSALKIQRWWRALQVAQQKYKDYQTLRSVTILMQRRFRANKNARSVKQFYVNLRRHTIVLQSYWRMKLELKRYRAKKEAAIKIQTTMRTHAARKIQNWWRKLQEKQSNDKKRVRAVHLIENWWIVVSKKRKLTRSAIIIQAAWRGHRVRQNLCSNMTELRQRCAAANKAALPTATLAYRWQESIDTFKNCNTIGQLSMCLASLDIITRLSPKECIELCHCNLVEKIYGTLNQCNRSLPWIIVSLRATSILITLAKFSHTNSYVCKPQYTIMIVRLLNAVTLNHEKLFLHLATLLWVLMQDREYIKAVTTCPEVIWLLKSIDKKITKKKEKSTTINTGKLKEQVYLLPSCKPDWGLDQKQPRTFTDIDYAITQILIKINEYK